MHALSVAEAVNGLYVRIHGQWKNEINRPSPLWVGFHGGDYDLYEFGAAASDELERLAEDDSAMPLRETFMSGGEGRLDGVITTDVGALVGVGYNFTLF